MKQPASLYIHYPYCKHLCNYCDFYKMPYSEALGGNLEQKIAQNLADIRELSLKNSVPFPKEFETIYMGGGTPSLWDVTGAAFMKGLFERESLGVAKNCEFTLEVDPGAWSDEGVSAWRDFGANRFSIGVQSYDEKFMKIMDRIHDKDEVDRTLRYFRDMKANFSVDLMLGLPKSEEGQRNLRRELEGLLEYEPSHLSVYILKTRKNYPLNKELPDDDYISEEYTFVSEFLGRSGFEHYEVSNFARPGRESSHNMKYWNAATVHALGPNATGFLNVSEDKAIRYQHKPSGQGITTEVLGPDELLLEQVYLGLRTNRGLDICNLLNVDENKLGALAEKWKNLNYVQSWNNGHLALSPNGFLMIDSIMDDLFSGGFL